MRDLRAVGVEVLTLGQYLRPTPWHLPVAEYYEPARFDRLKEAGLREGFVYVASGPLVRSSYRAGEFFLESELKKRKAQKKS
jgi:lipoic acid synthetase